MKHTPGPWKIGKMDRVINYISIFAKTGINKISYIAKTDGHEVGYGISQNEMIANARLIAAAPELLEACKMAKKYLEPDLIEPGRTVFWKLVDAIRKAEEKP